MNEINRYTPEGGTCFYCRELEDRERMINAGGKVCSNCKRYLHADDDGTEGDMWAGHREASQEKKKGNIESSFRILEEHGIDFYRYTDVHFKVGDWDFWPSTGKYYNQKTGAKGRGVFNLIKIIKKT